MFALSACSLRRWIVCGYTTVRSELAAILGVNSLASGFNLLACATCTPDDSWDECMLVVAIEVGAYE